MIDITKEQDTTIFCYDIKKKEKFSFDNLNFCCVWILDSIVNQEYYKTKNRKDFTFNIACNLNDYIYKKIEYRSSTTTYVYTNTIELNRYMFFDSHDRILSKSFLIDKCLEISEKQKRNIRTEYRKRKARQYWGFKSAEYERKWNFRQSLIKNKFYSGYRHVRTTQERRLSCSNEHKPFVRGKRNFHGLPNSWDDIWAHIEYNWKRQTKFRKQWMKNLWK